MNILNKKALIISLIKDDLINTKLTSTLNELGLDADNYSLHLGETIFSLMGFAETLKNDLIYEKVYYAMTEEVKKIDFRESIQPIDILAERIYQELLDAKRVLYG